MFHKLHSKNLSVTTAAPTRDSFRSQSRFADLLPRNRAKAMPVALAISSISALFLGSLCLPGVAYADQVTAPAAAAAPALRIAIIDTRRAVLETEEGLRVTATLKKLFDSRQVELTNREKQLQQEGEDLTKEERAKGPNRDLEAKKEALRLNIAKLQQTLMEYQRDMQRKEQEMTNPMLARVMGLVKRMATQYGYDMVVDKGVVPYYRQDLDLTDRVIQMYNAEGTKDEKKKGPKPPTPPKKK